jgi:hypothetical protein
MVTVDGNAAQIPRQLGMTKWGAAKHQSEQSLTLPGLTSLPGLSPGTETDCNHIETIITEISG